MQNTTWKDLWKLKLPGKVLVFLWRLTHNSLSTRMNIKRKKIVLDTRCPMCWQLDEDGGHLSLHCKVVKKISRAMDGEDIRISLCDCQNAFQVTKEILSQAGKEVVSYYLALDMVDNEKQGQCRRENTVSRGSLLPNPKVPDGVHNNRSTRSQ
jgi:hypothetical protein